MVTLFCCFGFIKNKHFKTESKILKFSKLTQQNQVYMIFNHFESVTTLLSMVTITDIPFFKFIFKVLSVYLLVENLFAIIHCSYNKQTHQIVLNIISEVKLSRENALITYSL